ncbi:organic solvent tolerance protein [Candidatus Pelagibacter sp.]|nr:organic solvent tolerance protein [Candidatus Pelagibacter sp.]
MKNKILYFLLFIYLFSYFCSIVRSDEQFNFDVTEIEVLENGNIIKGLKKGTIKTNDGLTIIADTFVYNKKIETIVAKGNVEAIDRNRNLKIYTQNLTYQKNIELITTKKNSKAIFEDGKFIIANSFRFDRNENILRALDKVRIEDVIEDYLITGNHFTYFKNQEKIVSKGLTQAVIKSKYEISSKNVTYMINENKLRSEDKTRIKNQNSQIYFIDKFSYLLKQEILKGEKILIITNYNLPKSDKIFLENGIIDLKENNFIAKDTLIEIHKDIFDNSENDPRLRGVSSIKNNELTIVNKGIFTSCKKNDDCPPWVIQADKIKHDKEKKQLVYDSATLRIYDIPVLYFPKFFHPDPTVKRQSGFLKPEINNSNILGNSITLPYFKTISKNKDLTITPTIFNSDTIMSSFEYRKVNKNSKLIADLGYVKGYKSNTTNKKKDTSHLFLNYNLDLNLENYISSDLEISLERVSNDNHLKVFDQHITKSILRPKNFNNLNNNFKIFLNHNDFNFETGFQSFENLQTSKGSDRYQYILPYYNFDKTINQDYLSGNINFNSSGNNDLSSTNNLKSSFVNNLTYNSLDYISNLGLKNNFSFVFQNLNSIGKKNTQYKSSPQIELAGLFNVDLSLPLAKNNQRYNSLLTPKLSFRFNPSDMKDYSSSENRIDANNVFAINRLGLSDTLETGRSITLGLNFKKEKKEELEKINDYFELKLATVIRDKVEEFIPNKSTIHRKNSNLFGSLTAKFIENLDIGYNFALDNDFNTFEYNDLSATYSINNFVTSFNFIEENGEAGNSSVLSNSIEYNIDDKNFFTFKTRRNRKLNLTEYYDLVYEYKNDCLTAGIKYKKSYYSDGDLKPTENLLFTITLFPLTSYEYRASELLQ